MFQEKPGRLQKRENEGGSASLKNHRIALWKNYTWGPRKPNSGHQGRGHYGHLDVHSVQSAGDP